MYISKNAQTKGTFTAEFINDETDEKTIVSVFPAKIKYLKSAMEIQTKSKETVNQIIEVLSKILSCNKEKIKITENFLEDVLDVSELTELFEDYFCWISELKKK